MKNLLQLQELDLKIERYKLREIEIPKQKDKFTIHIQRLDTELKESEDRVKKLQLEQKECEGEIQDKKENINKYESQLLSVKKNDEYQALLHEIDIQKKQIGIKEERIIAILLEIDEANAQFDEDKQRIANERKEIENEFAQIDAELAEAQKERGGLESEREPLISVIDAALFRQYSRIRKSMKNGAAIVPLRDETCSGCNMKVRAQVVNEVLGGEIQHCHHCRRILYHAPNFENTPAETEA